MTNFLFSTGLRQRSLIHLQIRDVDLYNAVVNVKVTKNRKPLIIPLNRAMMEILKEFLRYRQCENKEAYLFCTMAVEDRVWDARLKMSMIRFREKLLMKHWMQKKQLHGLKTMDMILMILISD